MRFKVCLNFLTACMLIATRTTTVEYLWKGECMGDKHMGGGGGGGGGGGRCSCQGLYLGNMTSYAASPVKQYLYWSGCGALRELLWVLSQHMQGGQPYQARYGTIGKHLTIYQGKLLSKAVCYTDVSVQSTQDEAQQPNAAAWKLYRGRPPRL